MKTVELTLPSQDRAIELAGGLSENLRVIEREVGVRIGQRGTTLHITGIAADVDFAVAVVNELLAAGRYAAGPTGDDVEQVIRSLRREPTRIAGELTTSAITTKGTRRTLVPKSLTQKKYLDTIREKDVVFGVGPAGTGKTYLAMAMALSQLLDRSVKRVVLTRPAVEAGEKLGFLPGDIAEKVDPYLRPLFDALYDIVERDRGQRWLEDGTIEVAPLAFMRGRTLSSSFVVLDEAQNCTVEQMKMFLTRLGQGSRAVVTGDLTQVDLPIGKTSGLAHALDVLDGVSGVAVVHFSSIDVVRHAIVQRIVDAYESHGGKPTVPARSSSASGD